MPSSFEQIITVFEYALAAAGLVCLAWLAFSQGGRAVRARPAALAAWDVTLAEFLFLAWLVVTLGFLGQFGLRLTLGAALRNRPDGDTLEMVVYGSMFHVGAILACIYRRLYVRRRVPAGAVNQAPLPPAAWLRSARHAGLTLLAAVPLIAGTSLVWEGLLQAVGLPTEHQELIDLFSRTSSPVLLGAMVTLALFVAPIAEELVFRAGLFRYLRTRAPRWVAFTASAGLFALLHANWASFMPLFMLGLVFALVYERTGDLAVPMLAHALFNLNTLLLVLGGVTQ